MVKDNIAPLDSTPLAKKYWESNKNAMSPWITSKVSNNGETSKTSLSHCIPLSSLLMN